MAIQKVGPIKFKLRQFSIKKISNLSIMTGKCLFGLMKMDTIILTSNYVDAPIFSYDLIDVMKNLTFLTEFYGTCHNKSAILNKALADIKELKNLLSTIKDHVLGKHWYDSIKLDTSVAKKGKKCLEQYHEYLKKVLVIYVDMLKQLGPVDKNLKVKKNKEYVDNLFATGGPSTDQFIKAYGKEYTYNFFSNIIFNVK